MEGVCLFILLVVIIVLIFGMALVHRNNQKRERFEGTYQERGFSSEEETYQKPVILEKVIDQAKIKEIIEYSRDKLVDSKVLGGRNSNVRNSMQAWIPKSHPMVQPIYQKVSAIYGIPVENAEDLQVVRYQPGQYYNEHHDSCCASSKECQEFEAKGGQRKLTVLIYLNDAFTEGETYFPKLNLKMKAAPGDAVVFHPLAENTQCHPHALHAGSPVTSGEKWIATIWFREKSLK